MSREDKAARFLAALGSERHDDGAPIAPPDPHKLRRFLDFHGNKVKHALPAYVTGAPRASWQSLNKNMMLIFRN